MAEESEGLIIPAGASPYDVRGGEYEVERFVVISEDQMNALQEKYTRNGYLLGRDEGNRAGYDVGYEAGYSQGVLDGYNRGYDAEKYGGGW